MTAPLSNDLRNRVIVAIEGGLSRRDAGAKFDISTASAVHWVRRFHETGGVAPGKVGGHRPKKIVGEHRIWLVECCQSGAFSLMGLVGELAERGLKVDYRTVWNFVHTEGLSFKKSAVATERNRPDAARRRAQWIKYQYNVAPQRLVFIDETWTKTNMAPLRGWAPRGKVWSPRCLMGAGRPWPSWRRRARTA